jgi:hypothetical protein
MTGCLLGRVLLPVPVIPDGTEHQFSAAVVADGRLWLAGDELIGGRIALGRLDQTAAGGFDAYEVVEIGSLLGIDAADGEADIEGLDWHDGYLWLLGSHSRRRRKARADHSDRQKEIKRLAVVETQRNRFLFARLPLAHGQPADRVDAGDGAKRSAARLKLTADGNPLMTALAADAHLKPYVLRPGGNAALEPLPAKENGFDLEGLAVRGDRIFLGLRGPVLVGFAIVLEVRIKQKEDRDDRLVLDEGASRGHAIRKHFLDLAGLGIRDLVFEDDGTLLILAGSTMSLDGLSAVYRWQVPAVDPTDTITYRADAELERLFTLPAREGGDRAEGLCWQSGLGEPALMVVYDAPLPDRQVAGGGVMADLFRLPPRR